MTIAIATALVLIVLHGLYSLWTAKRLDRLHARLDAAGAALDDQLRLRAEAVTTYAAATPHRSAARVATDAARAALAASGLGRDREAAESALSRAVQQATEQLGEGRPEADALVDAYVRASFARRFYNDAVRDVLVLRRRRVVRFMRLAGHAPQPAYFEIDDAPLGISDVVGASAPYD